MNKRKQKELRQLRSPLTLEQVEKRISEAAKAAPAPLHTTTISPGAWGGLGPSLVAAIMGSPPFLHGHGGRARHGFSGIVMDEQDPLQVGDLVTRDGSDVHIVRSIGFGGDHGEFECLVPPMPDTWDGRQWARVGDIERNLTRRYVRLSDEQLESVQDLLPDWLADVPA